EISAPSETTEVDKELQGMALGLPSKVEKIMDSLQFSDDLVEIWKLIGRTNKYIDETMPWVLAKNESQRPRLGTVLYHLAESLRFISVLISPFMPQTPIKIREQLGIGEGDLASWESLSSFGRIPEGVKVNRGKAIFPRLDVEKELEELAKILPVDSNQAQEQSKKKAAKVEAKEKDGEDNGSEITIDDFAKLDLRVAKVIAAEKIENADK